MTPTPPPRPPPFGKLDAYLASRGRSCPHCGRESIRRFPAEGRVDRESDARKMIRVIPCSCAHCLPEWEEYYEFAGLRPLPPEGDDAK